MYNITLRHIHETTVVMESNMYYIFLRVCACVHMDAPICVCACTCMHEHGHVCAHVGLLDPVFHAQAPYCLRPL
jgi:hypothetical protein